MVLHAIGICPICTYRSGRQTRNIPRSLDRLHDTVAAYARASLRLRASAGGAFELKSSASASSMASCESSLPHGGGGGCGGRGCSSSSIGNGGCYSISSSSSSSSSSINSSSNSSSSTVLNPAPPPPAHQPTTLPAPEDPHSLLLTAKATTKSRLLTSLITFTADLPKLDLAEVSEALFGVLLELTQTLEGEELLVLGYGGGRGEGEGNGRAGGSGRNGNGNSNGVGKKSTDVQFKSQMATRIEAVKVALAAPEGWYLEEMVRKFEAQGREVVRMMVGAAVSCVGKGGRVVLGEEGGREFWEDGVLGEVGDGEGRVGGDEVGGVGDGAVGDGEFKVARGGELD